MKPIRDLRRAERGIEEFLAGLGFNTESDPELQETPKRVVNAFSQDLLSGIDMDEKSTLLNEAVPIPYTYTGIITVRNIAITSVCPHHLLPSLGYATVIYIPRTKTVGLGSIARLVNGHARRLVFQETVGENVVHALIEHADAKAALCRLTMLHMCMAARGERRHEARVETVAMGGSFAEPGADRDLALAELKTTTPEKSW